MKILVVGSPKRDFHIGFDNFVLGLARLGIEFDHYPNILKESYNLTGTYKLKFDCAAVSYPEYADIIENLRKKKYNLIITTVSYVNYRGGRHGIFSYAAKKLKYSLKSNKHRLGGTLISDWMRDGIELPPFVVLDDVDDPFIWPVDFDLLVNCKLYFKRELPFDRFLCFRLFDSRLNKTQLVALADKLRPVWISYDIDSIKAFADISSAAPYEKRDIDISMLFNSHASYSRIGFLKYADALAKEMKVVDIRSARLSKEGFYDTVKMSRISVSPDGRGWDCPKHYELMLCGALLFITRPTIETSVDFKDGENCVFVDNNLANFEKLARYYLANPELSAGIAARGYEYAINCLGNDKLAQYVIKNIEAADK